MRCTSGVRSIGACCWTRVPCKPLRVWTDVPAKLLEPRLTLLAHHVRVGSGEDAVVAPEHAVRRASVLGKDPKRLDPALPVLREDNDSFSLGPYNINVLPRGYSDQKALARMFLSGRKAGPNAPSYPAVGGHRPLNPQNEGTKLVTERFVARPTRISPRRSCSAVKWPQTDRNRCRPPTCVVDCRQRGGVHATLAYPAEPDTSAHHTWQPEIRPPDVELGAAASTGVLARVMGRESPPCRYRAPRAPGAVPSPRIAWDSYACC